MDEENLEEVEQIPRYMFFNKGNRSDYFISVFICLKDICNIILPVQIYVHPGFIILREIGIQNRLILIAGRINIAVYLVNF